MPRLIRGADLTDRQREQVLAAFVHRNTVEHRFPRSGGRPVLTDAECLRCYAFWFVNDGSRLAANRQSCEPLYDDHEESGTLPNGLPYLRRSVNGLVQWTAFGLSEYDAFIPDVTVVHVFSERHERRAGKIAWNDAVLSDTSLEPMPPQLAGLTEAAPFALYDALCDADPQRSQQLGQPAEAARQSAA